LLWRDPAKTKAIDQAQAAAIWVDVLAGLPQAQTADLTHFKNELQNALRARIISTRARFGKHEFELSIWSPGPGADHLYLRDSAFGGIEISGSLAALSVCDAGSATPVHFTSARWSRIAETRDGSLLLDFDVIQNWSCGTDALRARAHVLLRAVPQGGEYAVDANSIRAYLEGE
jgi:hypothetical protein